MSRILIIDDDKSVYVLLKAILGKEGYSVDAAYNANSAISKLSTQNYLMIFCDLNLPDMHGSDLLKKVHQFNDRIPFIIVTADHTIKSAVTLVKAGASDYITKPFTREDVLSAVEACVATKNTRADSVKKTEPSVSQPSTYDSVFSNHLYIDKSTGKVKKLDSLVKLVAGTDYTVVLTGSNSMVKKEIARTIHGQSDRAGRPFLHADCKTMSADALYKALFGFESDYRVTNGLIENADGGTIYLRSVDSSSDDIQKGLFRLLKEGTIKRLEASKATRVNTRLIVSAAAPLEEAVAMGTFRKDLYLMINEFSLQILPLHDQAEKIEQFARHYLFELNSKNNKQIPGFEKKVIELFKKYNWPGGFTELRDIVESASAYTRTKLIKPEWLPFHLRNQVVKPKKSTALYPETDDSEDLRLTAMEAEKNKIIEVLQSVNHNKSKAARILKIDRKTLYNKMSKYNIF